MDSRDESKGSSPFTIGSCYVSPVQPTEIQTLLLRPSLGSFGARGWVRSAPRLWVRSVEVTVEFAARTTIGIAWRERIVSLFIRIAKKLGGATPHHLYHRGDGSGL